MRAFWILFLCCAWLPVSAQNTSNPRQYPSTYRGDKNTAIAAPVEVSVDYSYLRANQGPGMCGCFNMNGGNAEVAFYIDRGFSAVADLTGEHAGSVNGGAQGLSLVSFTAGPRFTYPIRRRYEPFAEALFGGVHGFDSSFPVTPGPTGSANGFATLVGGGLDIRLKSYVAIRAFQADYFLTHLPNGVNDRQNNLRLTAGIVLRLW
jgi:peptidoglycan-associated lipoprotein